MSSEGVQKEEMDCASRGHGSPLCAADSKDTPGSESTGLTVALRLLIWNCYKLTQETVVSYLFQHQSFLTIVSLIEGSSRVAALTSIPKLFKSQLVKGIIFQPSF